jgi:hypothetical protein
MQKIAKILTSIVLGAFFGGILIESQAISWYRIQEMFYFQSFHMYGLLGSAILTGFISLKLINYFKVKTIYKNEIIIKPKQVTWKANFFGGIIFGLGWGLSGACSAPLFILIGIDWKLGFILLVGALLGTLTFGLLEKSLPK